MYRALFKVSKSGVLALRAHCVFMYGMGLTFVMCLHIFP